MRVRPSPVSLRSPPLAHRRCATRQAHARVRQEGAVRERCHDAFSAKLLPRTAREGGPSPKGLVGEGSAAPES